MKRILAAAFISTGALFYSQSLGDSPYAAFGIGDVKYDNTIEIAAMGGISTAYISDFNSSFNFKNPAANGNLELTSLKLEATNENSFFKSGLNNAKYTKNSTYLSNLSLAFPISQKVKFGIGYQPYSSKKYNIITTESLPSGEEKYNNFHGEGTLSTVHAAVGYQVTPEFGLGIRSNLYFGNVYDIKEMTTSNSSLVNGLETRNSVKNFNFTLGATYQKTDRNDRKLTLGATSTIGNTGDLTTYFTNSTYYYSTGDVKNSESIIEATQTKSKNLIPMEFSLGAGYGENTKWFLGTQFDYKKGENIQFSGTPFQLQDSYKVAAGGWILPNANNFRSYFQRVIYRYGAYFEKGNLNLNGTNINTVALTLGATFPFKNTNLSRMTGLDVAVELGKRGTTKNNLINQNFINFRVGFNFADKWFRKALYD